MTTFSSTCRKQRAQEVEQTCSIDILPPAKHCISQRFHSVLKQCRQLEMKSLNTRAREGYVTLKPLHLESSACSSPGVTAVNHADAWTLDKMGSCSKPVTPI